MSIDDDVGVELSPEEVFSSLGHETRLAILYALREAREPLEHVPKHALTFEELRRRVGVRDASQFNYHLKQLLDRFVLHTEDGYVLRLAGERIVSTMLAGALTEEVVFDSEPFEEPCPLCGGQVVIEGGTDRTRDHCVIRCTECEGAFPSSDGPDGSLSVLEFLPPAGMRNRSPKEVFRAYDIWTKHQIMSMVEGVCSECTGTVSVTPLFCEDHTAGDGRVCRECGTIWKLCFLAVCDVCHMSVESPSDRYLLAHPTFDAFYHDHGYDVWGHEWVLIGTETLEDQTVVSEDPLEFRVVVAVDDDRLVATLDGEGTVTDVRKGDD